MPTNFFDLPGEIRIEIYKYLLMRKEPIIPWKGAKNGLAYQLLFVNRQIHHEAAHVLYSRNSFDLTRYEIETFYFGLIPWFLKRIGSKNRSAVQHIQMDFLGVHITREEAADRVDKVALQDISIRNMRMIQAFCPNLQTITITINGTVFCDADVRVPGRHRPVFVLSSLNRPYMVLVDPQFREISKRIDVEVYEEAFHSPSVEDSYDPFFVNLYGQHLKETATKEIIEQMRMDGWIFNEVRTEDEKGICKGAVDESYEDDLEYDEGEDRLESWSELKDLIVEAERFVNPLKKWDDR
ncbi:hypothetical protein N7541_003473 [Penicillium brevicompactum]|uniref:Uncharacterized protein n=1 Tax=Penicillium brevicompactum TaxID=5074 RepID=A0A9W9RPF8_PENBR|nr:hypothetical protein N7541_003473 [Penicillium brevicompactum]